MFTGLIQQVGKISQSLESGAVLGVEVGHWPDLNLGESVAVNGVCLTVTSESHGILTFDVSPETAVRTNLGALKTGDRVNIERAMRPMDRFGGHIVQGHVDQTGELVKIEAAGEFTVFHWKVDAEADRYLIDKGSITLNGISLTVVRPENGQFETWIIPATLEHTDLRDRQPGDRVNVEFDVLAKHVEKLINSRDPRTT